MEPTGAPSPCTPCIWSFMQPLCEAPGQATQPVHKHCQWLQPSQRGAHWRSKPLHAHDSSALHVHWALSYETAVKTNSAQ